MQGEGPWESLNRTPSAGERKSQSTIRDRYKQQETCFSVVNSVTEVGKTVVYFCRDVLLVYLVWRLKRSTFVALHVINIPALGRGKIHCAFPMHMQFLKHFNFLLEKKPPIQKQGRNNRPFYGTFLKEKQVVSPRQ